MTKTTMILKTRMKKTVKIPCLMLMMNDGIAGDFVGVLVVGDAVRVEVAGEAVVEFGVPVAAVVVAAGCMLHCV